LKRQRQHVVISLSTRCSRKKNFKKFKCGDTSQGIVASFEADVCAENCVFIGINELLKNNEKYDDGDDINLPDSRKTGGFKLINCLYDKEATGSFTPLDTDKDINCIKGINLISAEEFNWHNDSNTAEIAPDVVDVNTLADTLYGCGARR